MLFYVEARVHRMEYESTDSTFEHRGLIEAESLDQAYTKFEKYWDSKTVGYNVYYTVIDCNITETII